MRHDDISPIEIIIGYAIVMAAGSVVGLLGVAILYMLGKW